MEKRRKHISLSLSLGRVELKSVHRFFFNKIRLVISQHPDNACFISTTYSRSRSRLVSYIVSIGRQEMILDIRPLVSFLVSIGILHLGRLARFT